MANSDKKEKTNVVIITNRMWHGKESTVSTFIATAYDEHRHKVDFMEGYFLEPKTDYDRAKIAGDDKAVMYGTYNIVRPKYKWQRFKWYVDSVPGRTGIAIHRGTSGKDTSGCLIPGSGFYHDKNSDDYRLTGSRKKEEELFKFFDEYGKNGIVINIGE